MKNAKNDKTKRKNVRCFFTAMVVTLCLSACVFGMLAVDYNTRWVGFGNNAPIACVTTTPQGGKKFEINALGVERSVDITAGYKAAEWTQKAAQQTGELIVAIYDDICNMFSHLVK